MMMPNRSFSSNSYRYGFNGKEKDNEVNGEGNSVDFGARIYDPRIGRWLSVDPLAYKYPNLSPYNAFENNPIVFKDPDGKDGIISITGNNITISTKIFIWGKDATSAAANNFQKQIMNAWATNGGKNWTYKDEKTGQIYNVKFDIKVEVYNGKEKSEPFIIPGSWNLFNRDNFVEVNNNKMNEYFKKEGGLAYVSGGDEGLWSTDPVLGGVLDHEFGHILGLNDRYHEDNNGNVTKDKGWETNIMSAADGVYGAKGNLIGAKSGKVEQRNIDAILKRSVNKHSDNIKKYPELKSAEIRYEIDDSNPSQ